jgi:hypothetical protein
MLTANSSLEPVGEIRVTSDNVRFGSKADIWTCVTDVRFTPISRHQITPAERPHTPLVHLSPEALEV